ncbi:MAG TPA: hypothetical protein PLP17_15305, partial [Oligoflexia bacterium]|nr:hypothetical protein [Oligoflexia bacterium]
TKLADRIAEHSEDVRQKKNEYTQVSAKYLDAVDRWQQAPSDMTLASAMGSLGREMQKKRIELEQSATIAIAENVARLVDILVEDQVTYDNLQRYNSQLNKHIGFLTHPTPMRSERRRELQKIYDSERAELTEKMANLRQDLPDSKELEYRRRQNADELGVSEAQ